MLKFRPQHVNKRFHIKERRYGKTTNYNFVTRDKWFPAGWSYNQRVLGSIFSKLHYLACHSPKTIQKRWVIAYKNFEKNHLGYCKYKFMTLRYANYWSASKWL